MCSAEEIRSICAYLANSGKRFLPFRRLLVTVDTPGSVKLHHCRDVQVSASPSPTSWTRRPPLHWHSAAEEEKYWSQGRKASRYMVLGRR